jgi:thiol-disulfide isomerase/thioredoxin
MKFVMKNNFTVETFAKFVENFKNGALEPYIISQEIPLDNDKANVKIAVANNFKELVIDSDKDTLIEFYAPWSRYCRKFRPIYEKLGLCLSFLSFLKY